MAMLLLAVAALPAQVAAATFDHGLRSGSATEAAMVAAWCANAGVPHRTIQAPPSWPEGNLHGVARDLRYSALLRWTVDERAIGLCTAHHLDDQAETFLMRAARGSGAGLSGIRRRVEVPVVQPWGSALASPGAWDRPTVAILRPLLEWRRTELRDTVDAHGIPFVDDPSNDDPRFERARVRALLQQETWLEPGRLAAAALHMAEVDEALVATAELLLRERIVDGDGDLDEVCVDVSGLHRSIRRRIAHLAIRQVRVMGGVREGKASGTANIERLLDALEAGKSATQSGVLASAKGTVWHFREAPPRRSH